MGVGLLEYPCKGAGRGLPGICQRGDNRQLRVQNAACFVAGLVKYLAFPTGLAGIVAGVKTFVSRVAPILKLPATLSIWLLTLRTGKAAKGAVSVVFAGGEA